MKNLLSHIQVCRGSSEGIFVVDGDSTFYTAPVDMANWDGCLWIVHGNSEFGCDASTLHLFPQGCSSTGGTFVSLTSEGGIRSTQFKKDGLDEKLILLDISRTISGSTLSRRYLRLAGRGTTGNFNAYAIKYNARSVGSTANWVVPTTFCGPAGAKIVISPTS